MNQQELSSEVNHELIGVLEQIQQIDYMIEMHTNDEDDFTLNQYQYKRTQFLQELRELLQQMNISPTDLVA
ncbi:hypothetical protein [Microscilla marina]|uniref:Uncharacterized protein n=1 Tax=Microscilla marina ATCC 23134 TaxID=313606 RepID=A1ZMY3_MICM2|nr:hypothetical protein [Microscilla marina]EAY28164.1 hypothetical protein M23134_03425 [Microscilla marina ATCC 23134]